MVENHYLSNPTKLIFIFWWYWGLNLGPEVLYHLSHTCSPTKLIFEILIFKFLGS
jgi:hypothetical protein